MNIDLKSLKDKTELYLMIYKPEQILVKKIKTIKDIYEYRSYLKIIEQNDFALDYIASIILHAVENNLRFRKVECIKVLKAIVKNSNGSQNIESKTIRLFFEIYKNLILNIPEDGKWALSVLIKNQLLTDKEIQWLIDNWKKSVHLLNRLLLYPEVHPKIISWAEKLIKEKMYPKERESEFLSIVIQQEIPEYIKNFDVDNVMYAISKSKIPKNVKFELLKNFIEPNNYETLLEISYKQGLPELIEVMLNEINHDCGKY